MFEKIINFFKSMKKVEENKGKSKDAAKERLHLVLMQDRANVSADFLELMKQEIIDVIKKYIEVDENAIDVRLTNKTNEDGTNGAPALYANIPITNIRNNVNTPVKEQKEEINNVEEKEEETQEEKKDENIDVKEKEEEEKDEKVAEKEKKAIEEIKEAQEIKEKVETEIKNDTEEG